MMFTLFSTKVFFKLKYSWFSMCKFLVYSKVIQLYIYVHSFWYIFHYDLSQDIEYSSLCSTVGPCCLSTFSCIFYFILFYFFFFLCYKHEEARSLAWRTFWGSFGFWGPSENPVLVHSGCCKATPQPELLRRGSGAWSLRSEGQRAQGRVCFRAAGLSCPHMVQGQRSSVGLPVCVCVCVSYWCPTLCGPIDCSLPGSCVHGVLQARILEWLLFPSPGDLPNSGIKPGSPALWANSLPSEPPGKPQI